MNLILFKHLEVYNHHKTLLPSFFISNVTEHVYFSELLCILPRSISA